MAAQAPVEAVDLARVADDIVARTVADVSLRRSGADQVMVHANVDAVERVMANLVDNAVRHAATAVTVEVRDGTGGGAVISVADDGPGIPAEQREHVFERFTRLDDARSRDVGGAGLGLAIVRELVRSQGGDVSLEDNAPGAAGRRPHLPETPVRGDG